MQHIPKYNGITLVLDHPSRFDTNGYLLTGMAGQWFQESCLGNSWKLEECNIRVLDPKKPWPPYTKYVALLGDKARKTYDLLNQPPGYPIHLGSSLRCLAAFAPQDCCDHQRMEDGEDEDEEGSGVSDTDAKNDYPTSRRNYRFWTREFVRKLLAPQGPTPPKPDIHCFRPMREILANLASLQNEDLYLDIETSRLHRGISCIGYSSSSLFPRVFVVPLYLFDNKLAYSPGDTAAFYRAFSLALTRNTAVIHNSMFDLSVLSGFYNFPPPTAVYDTMIAHHRIYPEAEKSLSHCIARWTELRYHKNVQLETFKSADDLNLWQYNGLDVYALKIIKDAQLAYAAFDPGLLASIAQGNASIIPYLYSTLIGLNLNMDQVLRVLGKLSVATAQWRRVAGILADNPAFNPASSKQCADFFHKKLSYGVIRKTPAGAPALGRKELYQLLLKHSNPLIPVTLKYRKAAKDYSMLAANLWTHPN